MSNQEIAIQNTTFEKILRTAIELPGVKINRANFLQKELSKYFDKEVVEKAIATNPAQAGLSIKNMERIAKACITYETTKVTSISAITGIPGGLVMTATVPADMAQFFGHIIRILQKLIYLYGWQDLFSDDTGSLDDETTNQLILFIGVMFSINAASSVITKIANLAAISVEKKLMQTALTKGTIYPIVKKVAGAIGVKMTKEIFSRSVGKAIPIAGAVISGGLTFVSFRPMAKRLQKYLIELPMADVDFYKQDRSNTDMKDIIDVDFTDIDILEDEVV